MLLLLLLYRSNQQLGPLPTLVSIVRKPANTVEVCGMHQVPRVIDSACGFLSCMSSGQREGDWARFEAVPCWLLCDHS
jgi:hypothetical protein